MDSFVGWPELAPNEFLPIFVYATLVLLFGVGYAGVITLAKMRFISRKWIPVGYLFWGLQTFSIYKLAILIHSNQYTTKVLMVTMIAYLFVPHLYFYLVSESTERYERDKRDSNQ